MKNSPTSNEKKEIINVQHEWNWIWEKNMGKSKSIIDARMHWSQRPNIRVFKKKSCGGWKTNVEKHIFFGEKVPHKTRQIFGKPNDEIVIQHQFGTFRETRVDWNSAKLLTDTAIFTCDTVQILAIDTFDNCQVPYRASKLHSTLVRTNNEKCQSFSRSHEIKVFLWRFSIKNYYNITQVLSSNILNRNLSADGTDIAFKNLSRVDFGKVVRKMEFKICEMKVKIF